MGLFYKRDLCLALTTPYIVTVLPHRPKMRRSPITKGIRREIFDPIISTTVLLLHIMGCLVQILCASVCSIALFRFAQVAQIQCLSVVGCRSTQLNDTSDSIFGSWIFGNSTLRGSTFEGSVFGGSIFGNSVLRDPIFFQDSILEGSILRGLDFQDSIFRDSIFGGSILGDSILQDLVLDHTY